MPFFSCLAYGMTESMPSHVTRLGKERIGSCGTALPNVLCKVMDLSTQQPLPPDQPGELWMKTPCVINYFSLISLTFNWLFSNLSYVATFLLSIFTGSKFILKILIINY